MKVNWKTIVGWILSLLLAASFLSGGYPKLDPNAAMVERFEAWGYSAGFARLTGVLEMLGGLLVLIPGLAAYGAVILCMVMIGAVYTHLSTGIGSPAFALVYLVMAALLLWLRRADAYGLKKRSGSPAS